MLTAGVGIRFADRANFITPINRIVVEVIQPLKDRLRSLMPNATLYPSLAPSCRRNRVSTESRMAAELKGRLWCHLAVQAEAHSIQRMLGSSPVPVSHTHVHTQENTYTHAHMYMQACTHKEHIDTHAYRHTQACTQQEHTHACLPHL